jgi:oligosaccharide reducing-end xylanase
MAPRSASLAAAVASAAAAAAAAAPRPPPTPPTTGAVASGVYRNMFVEAGYAAADVEAKINATFTQLYLTGDPASQRIYYEIPAERSAYVTDVKNGDVRTEGMGYGLMVMVQLDRQAEFDKLWAFVDAHMLHKDPSDPLFGWSDWHTTTTGQPLADGPAPDGETWFITAHYFASTRWGDGSGRWNYSAVADMILGAVTSKPDPNGFFTPQGIVRFDPGTPFTDPSYFLPAFYDAWARKASVTPPRWAAAANATRDVLVASVWPATGLSPHTCGFDGGPGGFDSQFEDDTWRTARNWAMDTLWWAADGRQVALSNAIQAFFAGPGGGIGRYGDHYTIQGTVTRPNYSPGLAAVNAVASLAANTTLAWDFIDALWNASIPSGDDVDSDRYYSGSLYLEALLLLSGNYRAWL